MNKRTCYSTQRVGNFRYNPGEVMRARSIRKQSTHVDVAATVPSCLDEQRFFGWLVGQVANSDQLVPREARTNADGGTPED